MRGLAEEVYHRSAGGCSGLRVLLGLDQTKEEDMPGGQGVPPQLEGNMPREITDVVVALDQHLGRPDSWLASIGREDLASQIAWEVATFLWGPFDDIR